MWVVSIRLATFIIFELFFITATQDNNAPNGKVTTRPLIKQKTVRNANFDIPGSSLANIETIKSIGETDIVLIARNVSKIASG